MSITIEYFGCQFFQSIFSPYNAKLRVKQIFNDFIHIKMSDNAIAVQKSNFKYRISAKRQQSSLPNNIVNIGKLLVKQNLFIPSRIQNQHKTQNNDSLLKGPFNLDKIINKKQIQPHKIRNTNSAFIDKSKQSLLQSKDIKDNKSRQRIKQKRSLSNAWNKKSIKKQTKNGQFQGLPPYALKTESQHPETASFYLRKGAKPLKYELKMQIKKYEVIDLQRIRPQHSQSTQKNQVSKYRPKVNMHIKWPDSKSELLTAKHNYGIVNMQNDNQILPENFQKCNKYQIVLQGNDNAQSRKDDLSMTQLSAQRFSEAVKQRYCKQRYIKSTMMSYSKQKIVSKDKKSKIKNEIKTNKKQWFDKFAEGPNFTYNISQQSINIFNFENKIKKKHKDLNRKSQQAEQQITFDIRIDQNKISKFESASLDLTGKCMQLSLFNHKKNILSILHSHNTDLKTQIASITKIMTCFLIIKICELFQIDIRSEKLLVGQTASKMPGTSAHLAYSDTLTVYQALHGLMLPSGNDAAVALGHWGGKMIRKHCERAQKYVKSKPINLKSLNFLNQYMVQKKTFQRLFILHMNKSAQTLKLTNTNFANTHGLMNDKAYSTVRDITKLACLAMQNDTFKEVVGKKDFTCVLFNRTYSQNRKISWKNTNKFLKIPGFLGVKTGVTPSAGPCLCSSYQINKEQSIMIVVLNVSSMQRRFKQSLSLLEFYLSQYSTQQYNLLHKQIKKEEQELPQNQIYFHSNRIDDENNQQANLLKDKVEQELYQNDIDLDQDESGEVQQSMSD